MKVVDVADVAVGECCSADGWTTRNGRDRKVIVGHEINLDVSARLHGPERRLVQLTVRAPTVPHFRKHVFPRFSIGVCRVPYSVV